MNSAAPKSTEAISPCKTHPRLIVLLMVVFWCAIPAAFAQDAVPVEIMTRTIFIKVGDEAGSAFTIDYLGKLYLVTARHVVSGVPESNAVIQVRRAEKWEDYHTLRTLYPVSADVDIAVFETDEKASQPYKITPMGKTDGVTFGQPLWFIGYPFGMGSLMKGDKGPVIPFMKRGTMSAIDGSNPDAIVLYIDGFNNPGFSGGPIVFWNFTSHTYQILGVVKGYREDTANHPACYRCYRAEPEVALSSACAPRVTLCRNPSGWQPPI